MAAWRPKPAQWKIIWAIYAIAFLYSLDWTYGNPPSTGQFIAFIVIGGAILIWRMQGKADANQ